MNFVVTRPSHCGPINTIQLDAELKEICPKIESFTVAQYCEPYVIFIHSMHEITEAEKQKINLAIAGHKGEAAGGLQPESAELGV